MGENIIRISISEAAKLFGVNARTIRRALKNEKINYVVVRGRYRINFNSLVEWSQSKTAAKNKLANQGIGQYVDKWKIKNKLFSPNPDRITGQKTTKQKNDS